MEMVFQQVVLCVFVTLWCNFSLSVFSAFFRVFRVFPVFRGLMNLRVSASPRSIPLYLAVLGLVIAEISTVHC